MYFHNDFFIYFLRFLYLLTLIFYYKTFIFRPSAFYIYSLQDYVRLCYIVYQNVYTYLNLYL